MSWSNLQGLPEQEEPCQGEGYGGQGEHYEQRAQALALAVLARGENRMALFRLGYVIAARSMLLPPSLARTCSVGLLGGTYPPARAIEPPVCAEPPDPYEVLRTGTRALRPFLGALGLCTGGRYVGSLVAMPMCLRSAGRVRPCMSPEPSAWGAGGMCSSIKHLAGWLEYRHHFMV